MSARPVWVKAPKNWVCTFDDGNNRECGRVAIKGCLQPSCTAPCGCYRGKECQCMGMAGRCRKHTPKPQAKRGGKGKR